MQRRPAFTLVEMLVSVALVLFIMVILTEAFGKGLDSFRTLKAIGDMETRLRSATALLRKDLAADHFEGKRRLSDDTLTWNVAGAPREGVFTVTQIPSGRIVDQEGADADRIPSRRNTQWMLHFTVKARGNDRSEFFTATVPAPVVNTPSLVGSTPLRTTFFDQPADARFQEQPGNVNKAIYSSQWAEVAYFLEKTGATAEGIPLHTLYRSQFVLLADNSQVNWPPRFAVSELSDYAEVACYPMGRRLYFCTPSDLATRRAEGGSPNATEINSGRGAFSWTNRSRSATPILSEVISFDIALLVRASSNGLGSGTSRDLSEVTPQWMSSLDRRTAIHAAQIGLRIYDPKTKIARQMTLLQDL